MLKKLTCVLISVYHTKTEDDFMWIWRPDERGYTRNLDEAGKYQIYLRDDRYNTMRTVPVDVDGEDYLKLEKYDDGKHVRILNNSHNRNILGLALDGKNLKRGR